jgi:hypothetical protein
MDNVHEIAQLAAPGARVVYVDNDTVAVQHSRAILASNDDAIAIQADLRHPREILGDPQGLELLDPGLVPVPLWRADASACGCVRAPGSREGLWRLGAALS